MTTTGLSHRERLLAAGDSLIVEHASFDFGVREVVERAGVSLRTFYQHFETRDDFALAIYGSVMERLADAVRRDMPKGTRSTRFRYFVRALVQPGDWPLMTANRRRAVNGSRATIREGFHLREVRPEGYGVAIAPLLGVLLEILHENGARADAGDATLVLHSLITETYGVIVDGSDGVAVADHFFRYHRRALGI